MENKITKEEYDKAMEIVLLFEEQDENIYSPVLPMSKKIEIINLIEDGDERLEKLQQQCEDIANQFTYEMSFLEDAISEALDEASEEFLDERRWYSVSDVTGSIDVTASYDWQ